MTWPHYDRDQFLHDVTVLLEDKGIPVNPALDPGERQRQQVAASELLSSLSVIPTLTPEVALDLDGHARYNRLVHGD